jgi:phenylpropionate dioxygenase-like ring-hydroxylating dioxygenase large terminal subunit
MLRSKDDAGSAPEARVRPVPGWARAMTDEADFRAEQAALGCLWTFLGFESDIPNVDDWLRSTLGGRSIFVQRFASGIGAFENRCAHRFYPLRTADRGSGPVVCAFHGWRYDARGFACEVPNCEPMFGRTAGELGARLPEVEVARCGPMLFGRFPGGPGMSLEEWLGDGFTILSRLATPTRTRHAFESDVRANWKLLMGIALDDYHIATVHPGVWGGYLDADYPRYFRFGAHSAYFAGAGETAFAEMVRECSTGNHAPTSYRTFQFFPNLNVVLVNVPGWFKQDYWFLLVQHVVPEARDRTHSYSRYVQLSHVEGPVGALRRLLRFVARPIIDAVFHWYARRVHREDCAVCEELQSTAHQVSGQPLLSRHETRVGWFEEEYARHVKYAPRS